MAGVAAAGGDAQLLAQPGSLAQGLLAEGSMRRFSFSVDLRHFQASTRLPLNLASVVLELELPQELADLIRQSNGRPPPRLAPLRTQPVPVARGSEAALPGGQAGCDFTAGLMSVATMLARGPVMTVDVLHRERLAQDLLLGRAHVPLAPLLQESWVDGRAGVFALAPSAADPAQHERVQIGTLHLAMSLEEAGPAPAAPAAATAVAALPAALPAAVPGAAASELPTAASELPLPAGQPHSLLAAAVAAPAAGPVAHAAEIGASAQQHEAPAQLLLPAPQPAVPAAVPAAVPPAPAVAAPVDGLAASPEFEAAWELELWKREEEAKWRRELREREARRMAALEETWRQREQERSAEAASLRSEFAALESKARQVLAAAEERERKVVTAEEVVARRRRELEREHAGRVAEAEAAVRRLQAECQHQLELGQQQRQGLAAQKAAAEQRAAAAEARAAAAESALQQHREQHARSEAGRLEAELAAARQGMAAAEARAAKAVEAKRKYKEQVVRLAQEVAALQQQLAELVGLKREQLDAELAKLQAEEAALAARRDASELGALRQQLQSLQAGGTSCASSGGGKENSAACGSGGAGLAPASCGPAARSGGVLRGGELCDAVQRLLRERELLLGSGAYSLDDPLVQQLDRRIRECAALAHAAPA